jgi:hypothetical protein
LFESPAARAATRARLTNAVRHGAPTSYRLNRRRPEKPSFITFQSISNGGAGEDFWIPEERERRVSRAVRALWLGSTPTSARESQT